PPVAPAPTPALRRLPRAVAAVALLGVAGLAFVMGRMSLPFGAGPGDSPANSAQSIDKVLVAVGAPPALADASAPAASAVTATLTDDNRGNDDSLAQIAKSERAQGHAATLEQAVAQAQGAGASASMLLPGDHLPASLAQAAAAPTSAGPAAIPQGAPTGDVPP